jgi:hypothetical protein
MMSSSAASEVEVSEMIAAVHADPINSIGLIMKIYTQGHLYLSQWKSLKTDINGLNEILAVIRRFEANGLLLDGKGLWILSMVLEHGSNDIVLDDAILASFYEVLLRSAVETSAYTICASIILLLKKKFGANCSKLFQTGEGFICFCLRDTNLSHR